MFKDNNDENYSQQEGDTVIGGSIKIEGDLASEGNIVIEGQVSGSVKTERHLTIGQQAKVDAEVNAGEAAISGEVNGNLNATGRVELTSSARINGDISTKILKVEEGAIINGSVKMQEGAAAPIKEEKEDKKDKNKETEEDEVDF